MKSFILNGKLIKIHQLLNDEIEQGDISEFEYDTLSFIKSWLSDQNEFLLKTSGSTGTPKEIKFSRYQLIKSARRSIETFKLKPGQTALACLNIEFVAGKMMIIRAIEGDLNLIVVTPNANPLTQITPGQIIDFVAMTPLQVEGAQEVSARKFDYIKKLLIGGVGLHTQLESKLQKLKPTIYHSYSMTETLSHVALRSVNGLEKSDIYHALKGVSFSRDERNCLIIRDRILEIKGLITNDIVELIDDKSFKWIGRYDNVINSGGIKIQIEKIEQQVKEMLHGLGIIQPFCILSTPDKILTNKMILLIEYGETMLDEVYILQILKNNLPRYHNPKALSQIPELIYTKSGKIDRIRNAEVYLRNEH